MKKALFLLMTSVCLCASAQVKKALFIGNSYTEVNNLPQLVEDVAQSMGDLVETSHNTPGGCTFAQHCTNQSMSLIRQGGWDVVVLQEQSQLPSFPPNQVSNEVFPYAEQLVDSIYANSPCAEPMFYMTWGRKNGDQSNASSYPVLGTYEGMDSMLYERYMYMAQTNDASVSPVGRVWRRLREQTSIELYQRDNSHPSLAGSYAAACCFYVMLFEKDPRDITYSDTLSEPTADTIRNIVKTVVYDNLSQWKRPQPQALFSTSAEGLNLAVQNSSQYADSYLWDFGDGQTSTEAQPNHQYNSNGLYTVTLVASRHCMHDTLQQSINVSDEGVAISGLAPDCAVKLYPNPAHHQVCLELSTPARVAVCDLSGRVVTLMDCPAGRTVLDTQQLKGVYSVRATDGHKTTTLRLIVR